MSDETKLDDDIFADFGGENPDAEVVETPKAPAEATKAPAEATKAPAKATKAPAKATKARRKSAPERVVSSVRDGYVRIQLEEGEEIPPSGLFIGVNGRSYLLQPGMEADVPVGVLDVLENAVMSVPRIDPQTRRVVGYKNKLRYPYRRL